MVLEILGLGHAGYAKVVFRYEDRAEVANLDVELAVVA